MADSVSALTWLNENRRRLDIRVSQLEWPRDFAKTELFDYQVTLRAHDTIHIGRGLAAEESEAVVKALAECLERCVCCEHRIHTSGVAAHLTADSAAENSRLELFEHDAVFCHLLTETAGRTVPFPFELSSYVAGFQNTGTEFRLHVLKGWADVAVALVAAEAGGATVAVGLGAHSNEHQAIKKALIESLPNAANFVATGQASENQIETWLARARSDAPSSPPASSSVSVLIAPLRSTLEIPFQVVRSRSTDVQSYLGDGWSKRELNHGRLTNFRASAPPMNLTYNIGKKFF